jgi:ComF family protein
LPSALPKPCSMKALGRSLRASYSRLFQSGVGQGAANSLIALRELAFPPGCAACGEGLNGDGPFCDACADQVKFLKNPKHSLSGDTAQSFESAYALAVYGGPVGKALRGFKYNRRLAAGAALAGWISRETPAAWLSNIEILAPVPLHPRRLLNRGFNQAVLLFRPLSQEFGIPLIYDLLARLRNTTPQVDLPPQDRLGNVAGAFGVRRPGQALGRRVLVVDDVYTTGATVRECARILKEAGADEVHVLTLAQTGKDNAEPA